MTEPAVNPPGGVLGREDTGDLGGAAGGLDLVRKRRACAANLFTSVSNSTACMRTMPPSAQYYESSIRVHVCNTSQHTVSKTVDRRRHQTNNIQQCTSHQKHATLHRHGIAVAVYATPSRDNNTVAVQTCTHNTAVLRQMNVYCAKAGQQ